MWGKGSRGRASAHGSRAGWQRPHRLPGCSAVFAGTLPRLRLCAVPRRKTDGPREAGGRLRPPPTTTDEGRAILDTSPALTTDGPNPAGFADRLPLQVIDTVLASLDDDKAEDTVVIDLAGKTTIADHMVVTSGRSARQVASIAQHLVERLGRAGVKSLSCEGMTTADWVLIDAGDVIVHVFRPEVRSFYNLEQMWGGDAPVGGVEATPSSSVREPWVS